MQTAARNQRRINAGVAKISAERGDGGKLQAIRVFAQTQLLGDEVRVVDQIAMANGDAFGNSGRTRGVNDVHQILRRGVAFGI